MPVLGAVCFKLEKFAKAVGICLCSWVPPSHLCRGHWGRQGMEEADVPMARASRSPGMGLPDGMVTWGTPQPFSFPAHPPPSLCLPPCPHPVPISQELLVSPSPLYRLSPSSPLFSILIILITLFASLSRRSNPSVCERADTDFYLQPAVSPISIFYSGFGGGKEKFAFLPGPVGLARPSLASQGHLILPRRMGLIYLSPLLVSISNERLI